MPRPNNIFKRTTNRFLDALSTGEVGRPLPAEAELARALGASRSTVRLALRHAEAAGLLSSRNGMRRQARHPTAADYFDEAQAASRPEIVERVFMARMLDGELSPGQNFSELDLARATGSSTAAVREFLIGFSRFGLVDKRPHGGWTLRGFDLDYARELGEIRMLFETSAMDRIAEQGLGPDDLDSLDRLLARHRDIAGAIRERYREFPPLDREFHDWIVGRLNNRFARFYMPTISTVFIYHYQWNRAEERRLNQVAVEEHMAVLRALLAGDFAAARECLRHHLATSREALLRSLAPAAVPQAENPVRGEVRP